MKNWFGKEPHPSDDLIHWADHSNFKRGWTSPVGGFKTFDEYVANIRAAYDLVHSNQVDPKTKAAFELLLEVTRHKEHCDTADEVAGEDL